MQILVHLGFNKCASSFIQRALTGAQSSLRRNGIFYGAEGTRTAQYGLSRYYGFGPDVEGVTGRSIGWLADRARRRDCSRIIVSSEYLSLFRPDAVARFAADLQAVQAEAQFLLYSRDLVPWLRSLFNQYIKTVDGGPNFRSLDQFVTHVLDSGAIDLTKRSQGWIEAVGAARVRHVPITEGQPLASVLDPIVDFAGVPIRGIPGGENASLTPGALYLTARLRRIHQGAVRDRLLERVGAGECDWAQVPDGYLEIGAENLDRLEREIARPFAELTGVSLALGQAA